MTALIILILAGVILIFLEVFLPGGILGLIGAGLLIGGCVVAYNIYGAQGAALSFIIATFLTVISVIGGFRLLPHTAFGKKYLNKESIDSVSVEPQTSQNLLGKTGKALSTMAPTGIVLIEEKEYEARSQSGMLKQYDSIEVIEQRHIELIVRKK